IRTYKKEKLEEILVKIQAAVKEIEESRKVTIKRKELLNQPCQKLDDEIRAAIGEGILQTGEVKKQMISMAGHDAANMGLLTKAGMIFVKSVGGMGHCRQEYSRKEDIVKAADALFYTLIKLDKELD
ncbi:MAG TPA: M20/M25/M40 family metallo-hydrolase, partial [Lachnospiraceae bacterium]|nr:M20/M25/M40 family metallo-hydrolase [Lachnospiraceae bacterium]